MADQVLSRKEAVKRLGHLTGWKLAAGGKAISCSLLMKDFMAAVALINRIAKIAQKADHHPDLQLKSYRKLKIEFSTHSAGGLTAKDFKLASAVEALPKELKV